MKMNISIGIILISAIVCITNSGCRESSRSEKIDSYQIVPDAHSAIIPLPRDNDWWTLRHQAAVDRAKQGDVDMIFVGDSIFHRWESIGKSVWNEYYADRNVLNLGFSGDRTQHVLWRLNNGEIDGISPKLAVVMIGTNNCTLGSSPQEIADGVVAICKKIRSTLPDTKILLLGIFTRDEQPSERRERNAQASNIFSKIADDKWIYYLNINDKLLESDGTLSKEIMPDAIHPSEKGYKICAEAIETEVARLMSE